jgi:hypothetical protein
MWSEIYDRVVLGWMRNLLEWFPLGSLDTPQSAPPRPTTVLVLKVTRGWVIRGKTLPPPSLLVGNRSLGI